MSTNRLARTSFLTVLAGLVGAMALLAGPVQAETSGTSHSDDTSTASGGALAVDGSVASGTAQAFDDSTASGSAVADDGSVASGCSSADVESTASGAPCPGRHVPKDHGHDKDRHKRVHKPTHGVGGGEAHVAQATHATSLAVTGSSADTMVTMAGGLLVLGGLLVVASRRRSTN